MLNIGTEVIYDNGTCPPRRTVVEDIVEKDDGFDPETGPIMVRTYGLAGHCECGHKHFTYGGNVDILDWGDEEVFPTPADLGVPA